MPEFSETYSLSDPTALSFARFVTNQPDLSTYESVIQSLLFHLIFVLKMKPIPVSRCPWPEICTLTTKLILIGSKKQEKSTTNDK